MHTMKTEVPPDVPIRYYNGSKKPAMHEIEGRRQVLPLRILANQRVLLSRVTALDGQFLKKTSCVTHPHQNMVVTTLKTVGKRVIQ